MNHPILMAFLSDTAIGAGEAEKVASSLTTDTILIAISAFLTALALWEYLAIRRALETASGDWTRRVFVSWRLLGILLTFGFLAIVLLLINSVRHVIDLPPFSHLIALVLGGLFVVITMLLFRVTLTHALKSVTPGLNVDALGEEAWRDPLTSLPNRRALAYSLRQEWFRSERHKRPLAILMIDLDNFGKLIDDTGHDGADKFLQAFAKFLAGQVRVADTVSRIDSDIFAVILPEEGPSTARQAAERLRKNISEFRCEVDGRKLGVTASLGLANNNIGEFENEEELLHRADEACTAARNGGHNRVVAFTAVGRRKEQA